MTTTFQHKGRTVTLSMVNLPYGHFISFLQEDDDVLTQKYIADEPRIHLGLKHITIPIIRQELDPKGRVRKEYPSRLNHMVTNLYDSYYNGPSQGSNGENFCRNILNGVCLEVLGCAPFTQAGQFIQPAVFDVQVTPPTSTETGQTNPATGFPDYTYADDKRVEIIPFEGAQPFSFSFDMGQSWTQNMVTEGLPHTAKILLVMDANGVISFPLFI